MKKLLISTILALFLFATPTVFAEETCVQVQVYGGGVGTVCGEKTHEPVSADLAGINPTIIGSGLILASGAIFAFSRKYPRK